MFDWSLHDRITRSGLSPDEYFYLGIILTKARKKTNILIPVAKRSLVKKGLLTDLGKPTDALKELELYEDFRTITVDDFFKDEVDIQKFNEYIEMFPKSITAHGKPMRRPISEVSNKFTEFFSKFPQYSWTEVLKATKFYVDLLSRNVSESKYTLDCCSFILTSTGKSALASYCLNLGGEEQESFSKDV